MRIQDSKQKRSPNTATLPFENAWRPFREPNLRNKRWSEDRLYSLGFIIAPYLEFLVSRVRTDCASIMPHPVTKINKYHKMVFLYRILKAQKMCVQNQDIFRAYKPLRNYLRKYGIYMSLAAIRAYIQNLQFNTPFPDDLEVLPEYQKRSRPEKTIWVPEWKLEALAREIIINSPENSLEQFDFRKWSVFSNAVNKIKDIDEEISRQYLNQGNIIGELHRIAHNQFPWQIETPNHSFLTRYYKIFNTSELNSIIQRTIGLDVNTLFLIGTAFLGNYLTRFATPYPISSNIPRVDEASTEKFLARFSIDLTSLKEKLRTEQDISDKFFYAFNSLRAFPIIKLSNQGIPQLICPIPTLLIWRYTTGLYYEICRESGFDNAFGDSFQSYIGECIQASHSSLKIQAFPEAEFKDGEGRKDSVDWIVDDGSQALFIECKAKRMTLPAKAELYTSDGPLDRDLEIMADAVVQVYKTIKDYNADKYLHYRFRSDRRVWPIVVTLEDWHLFGDNTVLKAKVEERLISENISIEWLSTMPFSICSAQEFEQLIQILQTKGISGTVEKKLLDTEKKEWAMTVFLQNEYPDEFEQIGNLFIREYEEIFSPVTGAI